MIYYAPYDRRNGNGVLQCHNEDILSQDNEKLINSIGLITMDEALLTGIKWSNASKESYLYTGQHYWTMSPYYFSLTDGRANVFRVDSDGTLVAPLIDGTSGTRPVINLKSGVQLTGTGSIDDPFVVVGAE